VWNQRSGLKEKPLNRKRITETGYIAAEFESYPSEGNLDCPGVGGKLTEPLSHRTLQVSLLNTIKTNKTTRAF